MKSDSSLHLRRPPHPDLDDPMSSDVLFPCPWPDPFYPRFLYYIRAIQSYIGAPIDSLQRTITVRFRLVAIWIYSQPTHPEGRVRRDTSWPTKGVGWILIRCPPWLQMIGKGSQSVASPIVNLHEQRGKVDALSRYKSSVGGVSSLLTCSECDLWRESVYMNLLQCFWLRQVHIQLFWSNGDAASECFPRGQRRRECLP